MTAPQRQRAWATRVGGLSGPFYAIGLAALVLTCLALTRDYAVPIAIAVLVWFLINALADALRRLPHIGHRLPLGGAQIVSVIVLFAGMIAASRVVVDNIRSLAEDLAGHETVLLGKLESWAAPLGIPTPIRLDTLLASVDLERLLAAVLGTTGSLISGVSLVFLYVLFLLLDQRYFEAKLRALVADEARRAALRDTLSRVGRETRLYLWLMSLISGGVALVTFGICRLVGLEGAGFWGFLAFALNFIPTIGSILAVAFPAAYGLVTLDDPAAVLGLIAALAALQFVAGEVVMPRLMGQRLNLSAFVILLVLVVWGAVWGPAGMFLAIPITVIICLICARFPATRPVAVLLSKDGRLPAAEAD
ncbi:MAG: AI-2E family transporter [Pseudomonadota bacterium]